MIETIKNRPAVQKAYDIAESLKTGKTVTEDTKKILFGQGRRK